MSILTSYTFLEYAPTDSNNWDVMLYCDSCVFNNVQYTSGSTPYPYAPLTTGVPAVLCLNKVHLLSAVAHWLALSCTEKWHLIFYLFFYYAQKKCNLFPSAAMKGSLRQTPRCYSILSKNLWPKKPTKEFEGTQHDFMWRTISSHWYCDVSCQHLSFNKPNVQGKKFFQSAAMRKCVLPHTKNVDKPWVRWLCL